MNIAERMHVLRDEAGAYLLEVLVALFLFGLAMMGLAQLGYASILGNKTSQSMMEATVLCQDRLEQAKELGYEAVDSLNNVEEGYGTVADAPQYRRVTAVRPNVSAGTKQVTVRVFWDSDKHSFTLETAISQR